MPVAMLARLLRRATRLQVGAVLLGLYLDLALRSTRWTIEGGEHLAPYLEAGPVIVACWHERLGLLPALWLPSRPGNPHRKISALASRHRDGRFIAAVLHRFGVAAVHGSSGRLRPGDETVRDRGGAAALRGLIAALSDGHAVVITPDGPRGPRRQAALGAATLAALSRAPIVPAAAQVRHRIILRSWDRMVLPLPLGRGGIVCLAPIHVSRDGAEPSRGIIEESLSRAADRADELCR